MPQSSVAIRLKADLVRALRQPRHRLSATTPLERAVWAKRPRMVGPWTCLALAGRSNGLHVLVQAQGQEAVWKPVVAVMGMDDRRAWAQEGFG